MMAMFYYGRLLTIVASASALSPGASRIASRVRSTTFVSAGFGKAGVASGGSAKAKLTPKKQWDR